MAIYVRGCHEVLGNQTGAVTCIRQLSDGRLVTGSTDHKVRVWGSNRSVVVLYGATSPICCIRVSEDGRIVAGSNDGTARLFRFVLSVPILITGHAVHPAAPQIETLVDGSIAVGSDDGAVSILRLISAEDSLSQRHL